jgi:hypothetical protein
VTENEQKQQLSVAYVHAVAARAGYTCQVQTVDDDSVAVQVGAKGYVHEQSLICSPRIEIQLKATSNILELSTDAAGLEPGAAMNASPMLPKDVLLALRPGVSASISQAAAGPPNPTERLGKRCSFETSRCAGSICSFR